MDVDSIVLVEERVLNVIVMQIVGNYHGPLYFAEANSEYSSEDESELHEHYILHYVKSALV